MRPSDLFSTIFWIQSFNILYNRCMHTYVSLLNLTEIEITLYKIFVRRFFPFWNLKGNCSEKNLRILKKFYLWQWTLVSIPTVTSWPPFFFYIKRLFSTHSIQARATLWLNARLKQEYSGTHLKLKMSVRRIRHLQFFSPHPSHAFFDD